MNGGNEPLECLKSISKLNYPKNKLEVIVVDNASSDGSDLKIKKQYPKIRLFRMDHNIGFAAAVNYGIKKSKSDFVFITNDDIVLEKNSISLLTQYLILNPDAGLIGGKVYFKSNPKKICSSGFMMNKWTGNIYRLQKPNQLTEPDWVQGCALLIPRKLIFKLGLLDPDYFLSFDDYDLAERVRKSGFKVVYLPDAVFWHGESLTVDKNPDFKYFHWYKSKFRFIIKHFPLVNVLSIFLVQIFIITPYRAFFLRDGRLIPFLKAFFWNLNILDKTLNLRKKRK